MRAVVQRVRDASVTVDGAVTGKIGYGLLIYLGVVDSDSDDICRKMAAKISKMRLFRDSDDKMNLSVSDAGGDILVVSQFTLYANLHKGNRPSFDGAGKPDHAERMYELFMQELRNLGFNVQHGMFGAHMHVCYENDGPVTIIADSEDLFGLK
ncbi:MAG: D-tyrosyl-tRNA(Tyr) deacylase [Spirochaetales bacterium]|nr:D-tyrosyl-tRNA(Tyr) deacylase [Spirochaetales bacterium]MBQ3831195.1 D-tyrosyl-tRNA(Tyr) deacylase [Spirochaetales bacterium]